MTAAVLLDHVSAYAAAVRSHLRDLSPEQIDDLTDGLEADLAEALEDPRGAVATGETPLGGAGGADAAGHSESTVIDLTRRFGPAADYAAELRAAAGLEIAPLPASRRRPLRDGFHEASALARARLRAAAVPVTMSRYWPGTRDVVVSLRPVWWVLRGWVWFVTVQWAYRLVIGGYGANPFMARSAMAVLVLGLLVLLSVHWGRGALTGPAWSRAWLRGAGFVAAVIAAPLVIGADNSLRYPSQSVPAAEYYQEDGVYVGGERVTNLFVYDAEGKPLSSVQIFDEAGRPVQTTHGDIWADWYLAGSDEQWAFLPATDPYGQDRWNVYPLTGAPSVEWEWQWDEGSDQDVRSLSPGRVPRTTPAPFAVAPSVAQPGVEAVAPEAADLPAGPGAGAPVGAASQDGGGSEVAGDPATEAGPDADVG
ncbi:hypothetical protein [Cellulomonas sp. KRMCY2]|uniref:hypothetical protein n=1 Tax=Cellulomonas sp. KRMCY2 TaxID=1304865 RepID=UPI00045EB1A9|nr:hypothetical protein [Cellulomonas sp. KRMCY2]